MSNIPTSNPPEFQGKIEVNYCVECPVEVSTISSVVGCILADAGLVNGNISIAIVDDTAIHKINLQYLQHDYPTDVLSFRLDDATTIEWIEGEVIVSYDTARRESEQFAWHANDELLLYIIHGTLHLAGMDDASDSLRLGMQASEDKYLASIGILRSGTGSRKNQTES